SEPTWTNGTQAPPADDDTSPEATITGISSTTTLRAGAFKIGWQPTNIDTQTYIFLADVLAQPANPAGWPTNWDPSGGAADYEMVSGLHSGPAMTAALMDIPTLSLVMDQDDLFHPDYGIYSNPGLRDMAGERKVSMELINPDGSDGFQIDAGIRIQGMTGRGRAKRSFRVIFRGHLYGEGKLRYPLFADSPVDSFDQLILRAGVNDSYTDWRRGQYIRDGWTNQTYRDMGQEALYGNFVHLYVNGLYWGLYNPIERPNAAWAASHMGGERDADWDASKGTAESNGHDIAYDIMMDISKGTSSFGPISTPGAYAELLTYANVEAVADYAILNFYTATGDWRDSTNTEWVRKREDDAGYLPVVWDAENTLEYNVDANVTGTTAYPAALHRRLLANPDYRILVADRIHQHFFNGGALTIAANQARYAALAEEIQLAIKAEEARWADNPGHSYKFTYANWTTERNRIINDHFAQREPIAMDQYKNSTNFTHPMYPDVDAPEFNQHGGQVASGFALTITSSEGTIYYTLDGTDPRLTGTESGLISPAALVYSAPVSLTDTTHVMA
ncbi:hypothetical protein LCGC14_2336650, partial [marine sediment metagenome]